MVGLIHGLPPIMDLARSFINGQYLLLLCVITFVKQNAVLCQDPDIALEARQAPAISPLVNFQVHEPVFTPTGTGDKHGCVHTELLMDHVFAFSYGVPFVGMRASYKYSPSLAKALW